MTNELIEARIKDVVTNHDNAREPAPALQAEGYGLCEPVAGVNKPTLFALALGSADEQKTYCTLIDTREPGIAGLAKSLMRRGLLQPCRVRAADGGYALVAGARRVLAVLYAHAMTGGSYPAVVPATVSRADEQEAVLESFDENYQRANPTPMDDARLYGRLRDERGWTLREIAEHCGMGEGGYQTVRNRLELLKLSDDDQAKVHAGRMTLKAALQKLGRPEPPKPPKGRPQRPTHPDDDTDEPPRGDAADYFAERDWAEGDGGGGAGEADTPPGTNGMCDAEPGGAVASPEQPGLPAPSGRPSGGAAGTPAAPTSTPTSNPATTARVALLPTFRDDPGTLPEQFRQEVVARFVSWLLES